MCFSIAIFIIIFCVALFEIATCVSLFGWVDIFVFLQKEKNPTYIYVEIQQNACNLRWKLFEVENTFSQAKTKSAEVTDKAHARSKNNSNKHGAQGETRTKEK